MNIARRLLLSSLILLVVPACGSAKRKERDASRLKTSLEESARSYNDTLRWRQFEKSVEWIAPEERDAFLTAKPSDVQITDVRIGLVAVPSDGTQDATVTVTRTFVRQGELTERTETLTQRWFRKDGKWFVRWVTPVTP